MLLFSIPIADSTAMASAVRKAVDAHQFVQSMSKKADCWDNAVSESFFKTLKTEWLYHVDLTDLDHAERELFEYIKMFYELSSRGV